MKKNVERTGSDHSAIRPFQVPDAPEAELDESAARLYWENKTVFFAPFNVSIPVAVSAFPDELYQCPRSWAERAYTKLIHYNKLGKGGHFAAWEQPQLLSEEIRAGFRPLRRALNQVEEVA